MRAEGPGALRGTWEESARSPGTICRSAVTRRHCLSHRPTLNEHQTPRRANCQRSALIILAPACTMHSRGWDVTAADTLARYSAQLESAMHLQGSDAMYWTNDTAMYMFPSTQCGYNRGVYEEDSDDAFRCKQRVRTDQLVQAYMVCFQFVFLE